MFYALLIFSAVLLGLTSFYTDIFYNYGTNAEDISDMDMTESVNAHVETLKTSVEDTQVTGVSLIDIPLTIASGVYNTFKLLYYSIDLYQALIAGFSEILGLPAWAGQTVLGMIGVFVTLEIISAIAKYRI